MDATTAKQMKILSAKALTNPLNVLFNIPYVGLPEFFARVLHTHTASHAYLSVS